MTIRAGAPRATSGTTFVDEHEVTDVVRADLRLEPVARALLRARHYACVGEEHVDRLPLGEQAIGAGTDARQRLEVELAHLDPGVGRGRRAHRRGCALTLGGVARGHDHVRAVRSEGSRGLEPETRSPAGHQYAASREVAVSQHLVGGGLSSVSLHRHGVSSSRPGDVLYRNG